MTARTLIIALTLSLLVAPYAVEAQQPAKVPRIGILAGSSQRLRERRSHDALHRACVSSGTWRGRTSSWSTATRKATSPFSPRWRPTSSVSTWTSSWWVASGTRGSWRPSRRPRRSPLWCEPGDRPGRDRPGREPGPSRREHHGVYHYDHRDGRANGSSCSKQPCPPWAASPSCTMRPIPAMSSTRTPCRRRGRRWG